MTQLYLWGGGLAIIALTLWLAMRSARRQGEAEAHAKSAQLQSDAESEIHQVQAERRDTSETIKRLDDGTF